MGVQPRLSSKEDMRAARVCLLFVLLSLASLVSGGAGGAGGRRGKGKPSSKRGHVAHTEDQCGRTTQVNNFKDARPASLCSNSQPSTAKKFCVCVTREDPTNTNALWKFKCGLCELRWKPSFNEADRLRKKARFERMRKTRRKLKKEQKRKQKKQNRKGLKKQNRKGLKYLHADD